MRLRKLASFFASAAFFAAFSASAAIFEPLFMVTKIVGDATVTRPGGKPEPLLEDHAYPYGSCIKVAQALSSSQLSFYKSAGAEPEAPQVSFTMAADYRFRLSAGSEAVVLDAGDGESERKVIDLKSGTVNTFITAASTKTGGSADSMIEANLAAVVVRTPVGECTRLTQRNQIDVVRDTDEPSVYHCQFASQSGVMEISGPQYALKKLKKGTIVKIDGSPDFTSVSAQYGEFSAEFEKGADAVEKVRFRTRCVGKIWREYAAVGGRLAVSVLVSFPDGDLLTYNYLEGQTGVGRSTSGAAAEAGLASGGESDDGGASAFGDAFQTEEDADAGFSADSGSGASTDSAAGDAFDFGDW